MFGKNMYVYFGKCGDGRYWFMKSTFIYFVRNGKSTLFAKITDVVKSKVLWKELPSCVRKFLEKIGVKPLTRRRESEKFDNVKTVVNVVCQFFEDMEFTICEKCRNKLRNLWIKTLKMNWSKLRNFISIEEELLTPSTLLMDILEKLT